MKAVSDVQVSNGGSEKWWWWCVWSWERQVLVVRGWESGGGS